MTSSSILLSGFELRDLKLPNRIALAPMTRARAGKERVANEIMAEYFSEPYPARAAIGVKELPKGAEVEMDGIMVIS